MKLRKPPYEHFPVLYSDNIIMRQILPGDIKSIVSISVYDGKRASTGREAKQMQHKIDRDYQDGNSIHWGITDREKDIVVGTCGYYRGFDNSIGELGFVLVAGFRGFGYMTSALRLAVNFGLNDMGLKKIIAITTKQNTKTLNLLNRLQFVQSSDFMNDKVEYEYCPEP
jgi:ribosomal-protein-alanine N-acetyltransferase